MNDYRSLDKYKKGVFRPKEDIMELSESIGRKNIYKVLSFGAGTQSTHLLEMHFRGEIDYDYIVFSDTGAEPKFIHDQMEWWRSRQKEVGNKTPFIVTNHNAMTRGLEEKLWRYILTDYKRFQLPLYCNEECSNGTLIKKCGLLPRQCTGDFKIVPVQQAVRKYIKEEIGLKQNQMIPKDIGIVMDIGFSFDEIRRVGGYKSHQSDYIYLSYPLIEFGKTTEDSIRFLKQNSFPTKRSRCYLCPFNCDKAEIGMDWMEIIETEPLSFLKACYFDDRIRNLIKDKMERFNSTVYFHYSRKPLREVYERYYARIEEVYSVELSRWIRQWESFISDTYMPSGRRAV